MIPPDDAVSAQMMVRGHPRSTGFKIILLAALSVVGVFPYSLLPLSLPKKIILKPIIGAASRCRHERWAGAKLHRLTFLALGDLTNPSHAFGRSIRLS